MKDFKGTKTHVRERGRAASNLMQSFKYAKWIFKTCDTIVVP